MSKSDTERVQREQDQVNEPKDLEIRDEADAVIGGRLGDPDEGGQAYPVVDRLAANSNETLVDAWS